MEVHWKTQVLHSLHSDGEYSPALEKELLLDTKNESFSIAIRRDHLSNRFCLHSEMEIII
jgi:hypothetical protein